MLHIEKALSVNWVQIKAEYIAGTCQRVLAEKYGVSRSAISNRSRLEKWTQQREKTKAKIEQEVSKKIVEKTADAAAENAAIAARIKAKLLKRLEKEIDALPKKIGSEYQSSETKNEYKMELLTKAKTSALKYKMKDLTAAYKDLTEDMTAAVTQTNDLLQSLMDLERKAESGAEA